MSMVLPHLVARLYTAARSADPLAAVTAELQALAAERAALLELLSFLPGRGSDAEEAFFRSPHLSLLKVRFDPGRRTPAHDHGTWAAILLLEGRECNALYTVDAAHALTATEQVVLAPGDVLPMPAEAVHAVACDSTAPCVGLHAYGADEVTVPRRVWHPHTGAMHVHSEALYGEFARLASAE